MVVMDGCTRLAEGALGHGWFLLQNYVGTSPGMVKESGLLSSSVGQLNN